MMIGAGAVVIALGIYLIFYMPLMGELRKKYLEYKRIYSEVLKVRSYVESVKKVEVKKAILGKEDISLVIGELAEKGNREGINFISMIPRETEKRKKGQRYDILPIEMEIESDYGQIVAFLGSLDELESSLIIIRDFTMSPDERDSNKFITRLTVNMHLLGYSYAK